MRSEYFPYGTNNWLIRALLYSQHEVFWELWENFRKTDKILLDAQFVRIKQKSLSQNLKICPNIFGEFSANYRQTASDSFLDKCQIILVPQISQVYPSKYAKILKWLMNNLRSIASFILAINKSTVF